MPNLVVDSSPREFFVWIDPLDALVRHQITVVGSFTSTPPVPGEPTLMFLPNPDFKTSISPFQNNLLRAYMAECNLELARQHSFPQYPSRLHAVFLLEREDDAHAYAEAQPEHVSGRILRSVGTVGPYRFSVHDVSWIEFLRRPTLIDQESLAAVAKSYWTGASVGDTELVSKGPAWTAARVPEVLFEGRIDFPDRTLPEGP